MKNRLLIFLIGLLFFGLSGNVAAQEKINIVVGPARQELRVDPGETVQTEVRFYNQTEAVLSGIVSVADFTVIGTEGSPRIIDNPSLGSPKYSGASWVTIPYDQISIASTNKVTVPVTITIPETAKPGGRYVAVYFQPGGQIPSGNQRAGSGVASRVASLLYIRVNGEITENALITRFYSPTFFEYGPVVVNTEILNRSDYHIRPKAIIAMTNIFGSLADQVTLKESNIFPDASLLYENQVGPKWLFGRYKLNLMGSYGSSGRALEAATYVWVLPWRVIAVVLLAILIVYILIKKLISGSAEQVNQLEGELEKEQAEIEKLKKILKKRE